MSWREEIKKEESTISKRRMRNYLRDIVNKLKEEKNAEMAVIYAIGSLDTHIDITLKD